MVHDFLVFVDFDSTLFNHRQFAVDWRHTLARVANVHDEQFAVDEAAIRSDPTRQYSVTAQLAVYGVDREKIAEVFRDLCGRNDYLFPDAARFMETIRVAGFASIILTLGSQLFQWAKIEPNLSRLSRGAATFVPYIAVDVPKSEYIAAHFPGKRGALIDDVAGQSLPAGFTEIHLDRDRQFVAPEHRTGGYEVSNLDQAARLVAQLADSRG